LKTITLSDNFSCSAATVVSIGNFDGVHRGHQKLIREVVARAEQKNIASVLITFEPHTRTVLYPELSPNLLTTFEEKATLIAQCGVDYLLKITFDRSFSQLPPDEFVRQILVKRLNIKEWVMGEGHAIGKDRAGGKIFLREAMSKYHIPIFTANLLMKDALIISSTQIRKFITEGQISEAVGMLGHPYLISAERVQGLKIGSQIGFPTLNFKRPSSQKVIPPPGVYAAELSFEDTILTGALYFGDCPTFGQREVHFEFHALELNGKMPEPGETGHIWVHRFIRKDRPFSSTGELAAQIEQDVNKIRQYFSEEKLQWR